MWLYTRCHGGALYTMDATGSILPAIKESQWARIQGKAPKRSYGNFLNCPVYLFSKRVEENPPGWP